MNNVNDGLVMLKKCIIIIGAGVMQVPAIKSAKKMGLQTVVFDYNPEAVGVKLADKFVCVSTLDAEASVKAALELNESIEVNAVITVGTDASYTCARIAEALSLPGINPEDAYAAVNKALMRERFEQAGIAQPEYHVCTAFSQAKEAFDRLNGRAVIKPADSMGARGVMLVEDLETLGAAFEKARSFSKRELVLVEEFMQGTELSVDMLIYGAEKYECGVADRIIEHPPYFIETGHDLPSALPKPVIDEALSLIEKAADALNINIGAAKADIKITDEGAKIGELAARLSGGYMSGYTFPYASGVDLCANAIELALGMRPSLPEKRRNYHSCERALIPESGTLEKISGVSEAQALPGIKNVFINVEPGDEIKPPTNNLEKAGNIISCAESSEKARAEVAKAVSMIDFKIKKN